MPSETFYCPACRRSLTKSAAAFVLGEVRDGIILGGGMPESVTCPGCGARIDARAMIAGKYDAPPMPLGSCLFTAALVLGIAGYFFLGYRTEAWRNANAFNKRFFYAEDTAAHAEGEVGRSGDERRASALGYYEMAVRGLAEESVRAEALRRAGELERSLAAAGGEGYLHQDALLSAASPQVRLRDARGNVAGTLTLRKTDGGNGFEIDFVPTRVGDGKLRMIEGQAASAYQPSRELQGEREASVRVLVVPQGGPDPELLLRGFFRFLDLQGNTEDGTQIDFYAVPTAVAPDSPDREVRTGSPAVRIHAVRLGKR